MVEKISARLFKSGGHDFFISGNVSENTNKFCGKIATARNNTRPPVWNKRSRVLPPIFYFFSDISKYESKLSKSTTVDKSDYSSNNGSFENNFQTTLIDNFNDFNNFMSLITFYEAYNILERMVKRKSKTPFHHKILIIVGSIMP